MLFDIAYLYTDRDRYHLVEIECELCLKMALSTEQSR